MKVGSDDAVVPENLKRACLGLRRPQKSHNEQMPKEKMPKGSFVNRDVGLNPASTNLSRVENEGQVSSQRHFDERLEHVLLQCEGGTPPLHVESVQAALPDLSHAPTKRLTATVETCPPRTTTDAHRLEEK
jgi:hypothetical protein